VRGLIEDYEIVGLFKKGMSIASIINLTISKTIVENATRKKQERIKVTEKDVRRKVEEAIYNEIMSVKAYNNIQRRV
jgi:hypothetical protein